MVINLCSLSLLAGAGMGVVRGTIPCIAPKKHKNVHAKKYKSKWPVYNTYFVEYWDLPAPIITVELKDDSELLAAAKKYDTYLRDFLFVEHSDNNVDKCTNMWVLAESEKDAIKVFKNMTNRN